MARDMRPLPAPIARAFAGQGRAAGGLGSPFVDAVCTIIADHGLPDGETWQRLAHWPGTIGPGADAIALRVCGALHRLVLDGADDGLASVFPPNPLDPEQLGTAVAAAIGAHDRFVADYIASPPQTNEVARAGLLLPALLDANAAAGLPVSLLEIGSSAGLIQNLDRYRYDYGGWQWGAPDARVAIATDWRGNAYRLPDAPLVIAERAGCDIAPVPIATGTDRMRLQSYIWPDQPQRLARLQAALAVAAQHRPVVDTATVGPWLATKLAHPSPGRHTVLIHTVMWQYLTDEERARSEAIIRRFGRGAGPSAPFTWLRFEHDGREPGGGLRMTRWRGEPGDGVTVDAARADYHGRWIDWRGTAPT